MIIPEQKPFLSPSKMATMLTSVFTLGIIAMIGVAVAALIFVAYLLTLAVAAMQELSTNFTALYGHADSFTRLMIWLVALIFLYKLTPSVARFVRPTLSQ